MRITKQPTRHVLLAAAVALLSLRAMMAQVDAPTADLTDDGTVNLLDCLDPLDPCPNVERLVFEYDPSPGDDTPDPEPEPDPRWVGNFLATEFAPLLLRLAEIETVVEADDGTHGPIVLRPRSWRWAASVRVTDKNAVQGAREAVAIIKRLRPGLVGGQEGEELTSSLEAEERRNQQSEPSPAKHPVRPASV